MLSRTDLNDALHVLPIIAQIGARAGISDLASTVKIWLEQRRAFLFTDIKTFVVLQPRIISGEVVVFVRVAWSEAGNALEKYQPEIIELAKDIGAQKLRFETARSGFEKRAPELGWKKILTTWEQDL